MLGVQTIIIKSSVPEKLINAKIEKIYTDYYQNYAIDEDGTMCIHGA